MKKVELVAHVLIGMALAASCFVFGWQAATMRYETADPVLRMEPATREALCGSVCAAAGGILELDAEGKVLYTDNGCRCLRMRELADGSVLVGGTFEVWHPFLYRRTR